MHCIDPGAIEAVRAALAERDPETLIGPLFHLFTRLAQHPRDDALAGPLGEHLIALALHPSVATSLRLAAGALAIEHRPH